MTDPTTPAQVDLDELQIQLDAAVVTLLEYSTEYDAAVQNLAAPVGAQAAANALAEGTASLIAEVRAHREKASAGWVACSERMPRSFQPVWFYATGMVRKGEYRTSGQFWITSAGFAWDGGEVTHWAPRLLEPQRPDPPAVKEPTP